MPDVDFVLDIGSQDVVVVKEFGHSFIKATLVENELQVPEEKSKTEYSTHHLIFYGS